MALGRFLRGLLPGSGSAAGVPGGGAAAPGAAASGSPAPARPANAWRGLPPIQRTVAAAPLVAPTSTFRAALPTARRAPTALAPLGHERGLSAPAGLVTGIAAPVQRDTAAVPSSVRPVGLAARPSTAEAAVAFPAASRLADTAAPESTTWPAFGFGGAEPAAALPALRQAPAVASAPTPAPLTRSTAPVAVPGGRVGGAPVVAREAAAAPPAPAAAPPSVPAQPAVPAPTPAPGVPVSPIVARSAEAARSAAPAPARRLRIGAPIEPVSGRPTMQRTWDREASAAPSGDGLPALPAPARPAAGPAPVVAREEAGHEGHAHGPAGEELDAPAQREPEAVPLRPITVARSADAPLVGTLQPMINSASPAVAVRVPAESDADADAGPAAGTPEAALAALERMDVGAGIAGPGGFLPGSPGSSTRSSLFPASTSTPSGRPVPGPAPAAPALPSVSRSVAAPAGTPSHPSTPAPLSRTITRGAPPSPAAPATPAGHAGLPLGAGMTWDPVRGMGGPGVQLEAASGPTHAVHSGFSSTAFGGGAAVPPPPALAPMVARESTDTPALSTQREEAAGGDSGGSAGGPAAAASGGASMPEAELDALARRLHDKIAARISRDLLIERERAGNLVDRGW